MSIVKEVILILKTTGKWDYAKLAQIVKLLGGPREALLKYSGLLLFLGIATWEGSKKLFNTFTRKFKTVSSEILQEIENKTQIYLSEVEKRKFFGLDTKELDLEYNSYMELTLNNADEQEQDGKTD